MHLVPALMLNPSDHSGDRLFATTELLENDPEYTKVWVEVPDGIEYAPDWAHIGWKYNDDGSSYDVVNVPVPGGYVVCKVLERKDA